MLDDALTHERKTSIKLIKLKNNSKEIAAYSLQGIGKRKGSSDIRIKQINGEIYLEDIVSLPEDNWGFKEDINLLKYFMYKDAGAVASGDVKNLTYYNPTKGYVLSFKVKEEKAQNALNRYIGIALEVIGSYFEGDMQIHLAFSLARERIGK